MTCKRSRPRSASAKTFRTDRPSYIGSFETNLKDLTAAYTVFPNAGVRKQAYIIERIDDQDHNPIYRAAHVAIPALDPSAAWMTSQLMEEVLTQRNCGECEVVRLQTSGRGKNGNDERLQGRVVPWLHQRADLRRVGRIRPADNDHSARLRRGARASGLDAGDEQGRATLSGGGIATDHAARARRGLRLFKSTGHDADARPPALRMKSRCRPTKFQPFPARITAAARCSSCRNFRRQDKKRLRFRTG